MCARGEYCSRARKGSIIFSFFFFLMNENHWGRLERLWFYFVEFGVSFVIGREYNFHESLGIFFCY